MSSLVAYETFLYIVAALLKVGSFSTIHEVFVTSYLKPESEHHHLGDFLRFDAFWAGSQILNPLLAPPGKTLLSPAADLLKRQANRADLSFDAIMEADLLAFLVDGIREGNLNWYPQTAVYAAYGKKLPFFLRASQHKNFKKLAIITGKNTAKELKDCAEKVIELAKTSRWSNLSFFHIYHFRIS